MNKRIAGYGLWLMLVCCLYFFENNTGTRIMLACSVLLPLIPALRRTFFLPEQSEIPEIQAMSVRTFLFREEEDPGDIRNYVPGDPVNRIHWKLSAKRDDLLIRGPEAGTETSESMAEQPFVSSVKDGRAKWNRLIWAAAGAALLFLLLLFLIPEARRGAQALLNRLYEASEKVNAYSYVRFPVEADQSITPAAVLLAMTGAALLVPAVFAESRIPAFVLMAGLVAFQVYFGLAFPAWANVPLFTMFALRMMPRPRSKKITGRILTVIAAVSLAVLLILPGVDGATETASETVRDWLGNAARQFAGTVQETAGGQAETRHVHTRSLLTGDGEALPAEEYRLVIVEEEQISMPRWIDYLRIGLLFLLTVALLILPFLPFLLLNARRKKATEKRKAFQSENVSEAVCAIFRHTVAWLEATDNGAGNIPFIRWPEQLPENLPEDYRQRFQQCAALFEEAAYSNHVMSEDQRRQALALLDETEQRLLSDSGWKQKLRLKYGKCLYI